MVMTDTEIFLGLPGMDTIDGMRHLFGGSYQVEINICNR